MIKVKYYDSEGNEFVEELGVYLERLSKKNNSVLYKLESYLGKKLLSDEELQDIRSTILNVSAQIRNIEFRMVDDENERL